MKRRDFGVGCTPLTPCRFCYHISVTNKGIIGQPLFLEAVCALGVNLTLPFVKAMMVVLHLK